ncbi:hypothetical protein DWX59_21330 [Enterocloster aldenensis]|nr:hypothetical protein [Clostridiales bacterium AHG0011]RGC24016.1 hypothetical protein DWX59_21330 [Enterocloster aldenensis]RGC61532.1 hypothetical protein DW690_11645 [Dorea longicatena]
MRCTGACLNIHPRHLGAPSQPGIFEPNSGYPARYAPFIWPRFPPKPGAHLTENNVQTGLKKSYPHAIRTWCPP